MDNIVVIEPRPLKDFVQTAQIAGIINRALGYLNTGFPLQFRGVAGTGKTTLAMHIANQIGRPVVLIHGDDEFTTSDLVGKNHGYRIRKIKDNFVRGVEKMEESMTKSFIDNRLTVACKKGYTLIYDEFTRSRPEANNILLSVLQEGLMDIPVDAGEGGSYLKVHPQFRAIFTSNPEEYAGVHKTQDALVDRMITIDLTHFDEQSEIKVTQSKSGLSEEDAGRIVRIVKSLRETGINKDGPTLRSSIKVAKAAVEHGLAVDANNENFISVASEILYSEMVRYNSINKQELRDTIAGFIQKHTGRSRFRLPFSFPGKFLQATS